MRAAGARATAGLHAGCAEEACAMHAARVGRALEGVVAPGP